MILKSKDNQLRNLPFGIFIKNYILGPDHPFKLRLIRYFFNKTKLRIIVPYVNQLNISLDPIDGVQDSILRYGSYEPEVWEAFLPYLSKGDIFWDIGANIGATSLPAAVHEEVKEVHCFEPSPYNFNVLNFNIHLNSLENISSHSFGISDREKSLELISGPRGNCGATQLKPFKNRSDSSQKIQCFSIDQVIEQKLAPIPTIVKVDVEEMEFEVISGAKKLLSENPPKIWVIESSSSEKGEIQNLDLLTKMQKFGYRVSRLERNYKTIEPVENFIFVHNRLEKPTRVL